MLSNRSSPISWFSFQKWLFPWLATSSKILANLLDVIITTVCSQVLLANFTGEAQYMNHVTNYQRFLNSPGLRTPKGLVWLDQWGSNRYAGETMASV